MSVLSPVLGVTAASRGLLVLAGVGLLFLGGLVVLLRGGPRAELVATYMLGVGVGVLAWWPAEGGPYDPGVRALIAGAVALALGLIGGHRYGHRLGHLILALLGSITPVLVVFSMLAAVCAGTPAGENCLG
jgi:hypothetical protein